VAAEHHFLNSFPEALCQLVLLAAPSFWLLVQGPSSPRSLAATWLMAWPVLLTTIGGGIAVSAIVDRNKSNKART
jgi:hypothetical protein